MEAPSSMLTRRRWTGMVNNDMVRLEPELPFPIMQQSSPAMSMAAASRQLASSAGLATLQARPSVPLPPPCSWEPPARESALYVAILRASVGGLHSSAAAVHSDAWPSLLSSGRKGRNNQSASSGSARCVARSAPVTDGQARPWTGTQGQTAANQGR